MQVAGLLAGGDPIDAFGFATCGDYVGDPSLVTEIIDAGELLAFVGECPGLLPPRVRNRVRVGRFG